MPRMKRSKRYSSQVKATRYRSRSINCDCAARENIVQVANGSDNGGVVRGVHPVATALVKGSCSVFLGELVGPRGLEPRTSSLSGMRSNRAELWAPTGSQGTEIVSTSSPEAKLRSRMTTGAVVSSPSQVRRNISR